MKKVDYLIVGQGIAGSVLALELLKADKEIFIINRETENTSSNKAGGLYNPITGRNMVKTWLADELFSGLEQYYQSLETLLEANFLFPKPIYRPFFSFEEQNDWQGRAPNTDYAMFVKQIHSNSLNVSGVEDTFGGLELNVCGSVDLPILVGASRKYFINKGVYLSEVFDYDAMEESGKGYIYKDFFAKRVIFCEGPEAIKNPYTKHLPFKPVKGELIDIKTDLPTNRILNRSVFMLPKNGIFRVGSTYDHSSLDYEPTEAGKKNIEARLGKLYRNDYQVVGQSAGVRPATFDRRPFIGFLSRHKNIGVFNGFGTKGVSLVPFFATQYVNYLLGKGDLYPDVDLKRVDS